MVKFTKGEGESVAELTGAHRWERHYSFISFSRRRRKFQLSVHMSCISNRPSRKRHLLSLSQKRKQKRRTSNHFDFPRYTFSKQCQYQCSGGPKFPTCLMIMSSSFMHACLMIIPSSFMHAVTPEHHASNTRCKDNNVKSEIQNILP